LEYCVKNNINDVEIYLDSLLVVQQVNKEFKVKSKKLGDLYLYSMTLIEKIKNVNVIHIRREYNKRADELANEALDAK